MASEYYKLGWQQVVWEDTTSLPTFSGLHCPSRYGLQRAAAESQSKAPKIHMPFGRPAVIEAAHERKSWREGWQHWGVVMGLFLGPMQIYNPRWVMI